MNREAIPWFGPERDVAEAARSPGGGPWAWLSLLVPLAFGLWSLSGEPSWRDDAAIVRDVGFIPMGSEGGVSTLATRVFLLLPLGGQMLRAGLVGVLALALASRLLFGCLRALLQRRANTPLDSALACYASLIWALAPAVQDAAVHVGGPLPALALVLLTQRLASSAFELGDSRLLAASGLIWGGVLAESHAAGASVGVWLFALAVGAGRRRLAREVWRLLAPCGAVLVLFASLRWLRPEASSLPSLADLLDTAAMRSATPTLVDLVPHLFAGWTREAGLVPLLVACGGVIVAAFDRTLRREVWAWAWFAASGLLVVPSWPAVDSAPPVLWLLSSLGVAAFFPVAVQALVRSLWACPLPFARPAALLCVTLATTLVLSRADRVSSAAVAPSAGAQLWTDEALGRLPQGSLVLVHSAPLALRLMASRILHGTRPDVVIVASALLSPDSLRDGGALADPSLSPLLRELWVNGVADEYALCRLADARPVFAELDRRWDRHLLEHLRPDGLWLGVSSPALGPSDRRVGAERSRAALRRLREIGLDGDALDPETRRVLGDAAGRQALLLAALGEREPAERMLVGARRLDRRNPLGRALGAHLAESARGRVAVGDLLR